MRTLNALALAALVANGTASAETITSPSYFDDLDAVTIDFDLVPGTRDIPENLSPLADQYATLGILFASEDEPGVLQTTDPADASGRFESTCRYLAAVDGGGFPTSGTRYAGGDIFAGSETSDLRVDFTPPIGAFAAQVIDNDFTDVRFSAYSADGTLIESLVILEVPEGGFGYWGIAAPGISYLIVDGANGTSLDSTYLDDFTFAVVARACAGDLNGDGTVDGADLGLLLGGWGNAGAGDLDGSGSIDGADLGLLLGAWGPC